jgi:hypothetical protein
MFAAGASHAQGENMFSTSLSQEEKDRKEQERTEAAERAEGTYVAKSQREAVYIFLDEPESSMLARIVQTTIMLMIMATSISFVVETMEFVKGNPAWDPESDIAKDALWCAIELGSPYTCMIHIGWRLCHVRGVRCRWHDLFKMVEAICIITFTVEYVIKVACCTARPGEDKGLASFIFRAVSIIDVLAIIPFYLVRRPLLPRALALTCLRASTIC